MQLEGEEHNSNVCVDDVEERMRDCFIQNKRPKRPLSPAAAAETQQSYESEVARGGSAAEFDPIGTKLRSLDLIYQFHA
nr:Zinc finger protein [Ipomoea batatas]